MKQSALGLLALMTMLSTATALAGTPGGEASSTRTPQQVAQGNTPAQPTAPPTTPAAPPTPTTTRGQFCGMVYDNYRRVIARNPDIENTRNAAYNGLVGVSMTVARHGTLQRLLGMATNYNCDLIPFLELESRVIQGTYTTPEVR